MTPTQAFHFAQEQVEQLRDSGIDVHIQPDQRNQDPNNKVAEGPGRIPKKHWCHISFKNLTKPQVQQIHQCQGYLAMCGITFDFGGMKGLRDWEFDWSFHYEKGKEQWEWRDASDMAEHLIDSL